jgi:hypothetical protein
MTDPAWRQFERMVAVIEHHLSPHGAVVKSPDRIKDLRTGQMREVDGSIRYTIGSIPILITLECRDRAATQDVTWIEQLATKKDAIGAACTVAVSSSDFSEPALQVAMLSGIQTRLLREIDDEAARTWADQLTVVAFRAKFYTQSLTLSFFDDESSSLPIHPSVVELFAKDSGAKLFREADGAELSIPDLLRKEGLLQDPIRERLGQGVSVTVPPKSDATIGKAESNLLFDGLEANKGRETRTLSWEFERDELSALAASGMRPIRQLAVTFEVELVAIPATFGTVWSYSAKDGEVSKAVQGSIRLGDGTEIRVIATDAPKL